MMVDISVMKALQISFLSLHRSSCSRVTRTLLKSKLCGNHWLRCVYSNQVPRSTESPLFSKPSRCDPFHSLQYWLTSMKGHFVLITICKPRPAENMGRIMKSVQWEPRHFIEDRIELTIFWLKAPVSAPNERQLSSVSNETEHLQPLMSSHQNRMARPLFGYTLRPCLLLADLRSPLCAVSDNGVA